MENYTHDITCPSCGAEWELTDSEFAQPEFLCTHCDQSFPLHPEVQKGPRPAGTQFDPVGTFSIKKGRQLIESLKDAGIPYRAQSGLRLKIKISVDHERRSEVPRLLDDTFSEYLPDYDSPFFRDEPPLPPDPGDWACPTCGASVPANFELCWNCRTPQPEIKPTPPPAAPT